MILVDEQYWNEILPLEIQLNWKEFFITELNNRKIILIKIYMLTNYYFYKL